jgi:F420-dependent oxidoreductase-like protein
MKLGLQIPYFTWPGGPPELGKKLAEVGRTAEDAGFSSVWVMDHYFQIPMVGPPELEMLEGYSALNYIAAVTSRVKLGTLVTGVTYRHPGYLVKQVTTLDVLSGGRAYLGIGAAWFEDEHRGLGIPFPPLKERFERLEEALQIAKQMWSDNDSAYEGQHYQLERTLCSPQPLSKPHPPIMVGGSGPKKTLRLVARYADACNVSANYGPEGVRRHFEILREHCEREGRNYDDVEKTVIFVFHPGRNGENANEVVQRLGELADAGAQTVLGAVIHAEEIRPLELMGRDVIPQVKGR